MDDYIKQQEGKHLQIEQGLFSHVSWFVIKTSKKERRVDPFVHFMYQQIIYVKQRLNLSDRLPDSIEQPPKPVRSLSVTWFLFSLLAKELLD